MKNYKKQKKTLKLSNHETQKNNTSEILNTNDSILNNKIMVT